MAGSAPRPFVAVCRHGTILVNAHPDEPSEVKRRFITCPGPPHCPVAYRRDSMKALLKL